MRIVAAVAVVLASLAARRIRRYEIAHSSMAPTLAPGDYVLALQRHRIDRGDIVIVPHPTQPDMELVKRIIGLPYEHVVIADGRVAIEGRVLDEPYAVGPTEPEGHWQLGAEIFVLGDQRVRSTDDSRTLQPIPSTGAKWTVFFRYWPRQRIGVAMADGAGTAVNPA